MIAVDRLPLTLLAAFTRALAHRIRTPLAVISNEMSFLGAEHPEIAAAATSRVKDIADILRSACRIVTPGVAPEQVPLSVLFTDLTPELQTVCLYGDRILLQVAFDGLRDVCARQAGGASRLRIEVQTIHAEPLQLMLSIGWRTEYVMPGLCVSVTELISERLGLDSIEAPMFDAIMQAHGIATEVRCDGMRVVLNLKLPTVQSVESGGKALEA